MRGSRELHGNIRYFASLKPQSSRFRSVLAAGTIRSDAVEAFLEESQIAG